MLDIRSKTWESDRAEAEAAFLAGTISVEDETTLRHATSTLEWQRLAMRRWGNQNKPLIEEAKGSTDLNTRLLLAVLGALGVQ